MSRSIAAVPEATVHRIASGQVILDLATAVKELLENALDAGATNIEIKLKEYGSELIEVADNGCGVSEENYRALTLKYHTSKLSSIADLQDLSSFGFRGEALSSLCAVSEVTVSTRTEESNTGTRISYDSSGKILSITPIARARGTTVAVKELFKPLPVRFKELRRHLKRDFAKLLTLLQAYAIIASGVRIICTNQVGTGPRTRVISTQGLASMRDNIVTVFGSRTAEALVALDGASADNISMHGFVSRASASCGKTGGERQYFFLNGRPVNLPKFAKALMDVYRTYTSCGNAANLRPTAFVDIRLPKDSYDINVTPDKRKALIYQEQSLLEAFQQALVLAWEPAAAVTLQPQLCAKQAEASRSSDEEGGSQGSDDDADVLTTPAQKTRSTSPGDSPKYRHHAGGELISFAQNGSIPRSLKHRTRTKASLQRGQQRSMQPLMTMFLSRNEGASSSPSPSEASSEGVEDAQEASLSLVEAPAALEDANPPTESPVIAARSNPISIADQPCSASASGPAPLPALVGEYAEARPESTFTEQVLVSTDEGEKAAGPKRRRILEHAAPVMRVELEGLRSAWNCEQPATDVDCDQDGRGHYSAASVKEGELNEAGDAASFELERIFQKSDFARMEVIGQFNLGFILARLGKELFIVDQHAADEKFNFERLQQITRLNKQPLLRPLPLNLTPSETVLLKDNRDIFHVNGFDFREDDEGQLLLTAVPFSKDTVFGVQDVQELLHLIMTGSSAAFQMSSQFRSTAKDSSAMPTKVVRPSRVRAMLAMRACRSSVMIGKALTASQMQTILTHLSTLESPWNCPHGRPTLRHLTTLSHE